MTPRVSVTGGKRNAATLTAALLLLLASPALAQITVTSATYGPGLPGVLPGNATAKVAATCNGAMSCAYTVLVGNFGDPAPNKAKGFSASWTCGGSPVIQTAIAAPTFGGEAGWGSVVTLSCAPTPTPTRTPTITPIPTPAPVGTPPPWPTLDPRLTTIHVWCEQSDPGCLPGGTRHTWQFPPWMRVLVVTPVPRP